MTLAAQFCRCGPQIAFHRKMRAAPRLRATITTSQVVFIPFTPVQKTPKYDLRLYQPHSVAKTAYVRRDEGFLTLGNYLSGQNSDNARCVETQPIVMTYSADRNSKSMSVMVVRRGEQEADGGGAASSPPLPTEAGVEVDVAGGELVAVMRFEGNATQEACERTRSELLRCLETDGLQLAEAEAAGAFRLAQYGPLHSLTTRVNEIWLTITL